MERQQLFGALWAIVTADPIGGLVRQLRREGVTDEELHAALAGVVDCVPDSADPETAERLQSAVEELARRFRTDLPPRLCQPAMAVAAPAAQQRKAR